MHGDLLMMRKMQISTVFDSRSTCVEGLSFWDRANDHGG
jgi:hypothetical protein